MTWFDANGRKFPWRDVPTPFRVWVSEIMLQQTTTQTVVGYFERFLTRFPNVVSLAAASEEDVLKYWEGLGYYRRAKALRMAAIKIVEQFGGIFPSEYDDVLALPGVGRYASGAILSFGFDKRFPILEANTTRLHTRLTGMCVEPTRSDAQKILWNFAETWLPPLTPIRPKGVYRLINSALTDLGRLVCAPKDPSCVQCPLANFCEAKRLGIQEEIPIRKKKNVPIKIVSVAVWISRKDLDIARKVKNSPDLSKSQTSRESDVLLIRRSDGALWAGLWDFPRFEVTNELAAAKNLSGDLALSERLQFFLKEEVGSESHIGNVGRVLTTVSHSVTKYRVALRVARLANAKLRVGLEEERTLFNAANTELLDLRTKKNFVPNDSPDSRVMRQCSELQWVPLDLLNLYPLSSPARRVANFIIDASRGK